MSYVPGFENDLFISYAHIDNQPLTEGQKGWITNFHRALEVRLQQLLGAEPDIWRDPKLQGNDYLSDTIVKQFPQVAVLVSVLSPRYVKSEWCLREMQEFCQTAAPDGPRFEDKSRLFKVIKTPVPREQQPAELQGLLGYEFYQIDPMTDRPREFRPEIGEATRQNFLDKLDDLAYDIYLLLEALQRRDRGPAKTAAGPTIYLAETTTDLAFARDQIRRDLQQRRFTVLPNQPLPASVADLRQQVREHLAQSRLSIHLLGAHYGVIPEGETRSVVCLQHELALEHSRTNSFNRVLWLPPGMSPAEPRQQEFLQTLQSDANLQAGVELVQDTLENLKTIIQDKLTNGHVPEIRTAAAGPRRIYLICDQRDLAVTAALHDYLFDQGFEVTRPVFSGSETEIREDHQENLRLCDAILLYWGSAGELWLRAKLRELQKISGLGRTQPLLAKTICVAGPEDEAKQQFRTHEAGVIKSLQDFTPAVLAEFVAALKAEKGVRR